MNKFLLLLLFFCVQIHESYSEIVSIEEENDLGVYCGSVQFSPPSFLNNSFITGSYTWEVWARDPDFANLDKSDGTWPVDPISTTLINDASGNSPVFYASNSDFLSKQLRVRVSRGTFKSKYLYFYLSPQSVTDNDFEITSGTDECKGGYLKVEHKIGGAKNYNIILYTNHVEGDENLYYIPNNDPTLIQTNSFFSEEILFSNEESESDDPIELGNFIIEREKKKLIIYNKEPTSQSIHLQIMETNNSCDDLISFMSLLNTSQRFQEAGCGLLSFQTIPKSELNSISLSSVHSSDNELLENTTDTYTYTALEYYENHAFNVTATGGSFIQSSTSFSELFEINKPESGEFRSSETQNNTIQTCVDSKDFTIIVEQPIIPSFTPTIEPINQENPLGKLSLSDLNFSATLPNYNLKYELSKKK